jgi:hypothetical protein
MRQWTILAQDPAVTHRNGDALTTQVSIPAERLEPGPRGHRVHVVDFDASIDQFYRSRPGEPHDDPYVRITDIDRLVADPHFHQQNAYAIVMATLGDFEAALGRPVSWGFDEPGHQLKVAPHAFADANAFYSRASESLSFGYFPGRRGNTVFSCLSHDVIAHETTHALLDGLRSFYMHPASADQAGFHEGLSDIVALLSVLKSSELVEHSLAQVTDRSNQIKAADLTFERLANNVLLKLAEQMGAELSQVRGEALRQSVQISPSPKYIALEEFEEPHRRGEILVAAVMRTFIRVWLSRLGPLGLDDGNRLNRSVVAEEGATAAKQLLTIAIRAIDYLPPVDLQYSDYLSGMLTADAQVFPEDGKYHYRQHLRESFAEFGILPVETRRKDGLWDPPRDGNFSYEGTHFEQMRTDRNAAFRFIWENCKLLGIERSAFTRVTSIRPNLRFGNDQFYVRETVVEYIQTIRIFGNELVALKLDRPPGLSGRAAVTLHGGGTLIFDEYGRLKFHIGTGVSSHRQNERLKYLAARGDLSRDSTSARMNFAQVHFERGIDRIQAPQEGW